MKTKKIKKPALIKKNELFQIKRDFLERSYPDGIKNWGMAMKVLAGLFELVKDVSFWRQFTLVKPYHILWLQKDDGRVLILKQYDIFLKNKFNNNLVLTKKEEKVYNLGNKVGADFETAAAKPLNLKDFLKED